MDIQAIAQTRKMFVFEYGEIRSEGNGGKVWNLSDETVVTKDGANRITVAYIEWKRLARKRKKKKIK